MLFRVDERLIHGQVVIAWGSQLHPDRIVVVDDELALSAWEQELYQLGLPQNIESEFATVDAARVSLSHWQQSAQRIFVLTRDLATMLRLARGGALRGADVNVGGIHHAADRRQVLPYVYLSTADETTLRQLLAEGVQVTARDLPGARRVTVEQMLLETHH